MTHFVSDVELRPVLFGFSLEKLRCSLGSNDLDLVGRLKLALAEMEMGSDELPETIEKAEKVVNDALCRGAPLPDLVEEKEEHVLAAVVLAEHFKDVPAAGWHNWTANAFWALYSELEQEFEEQARRLFSFFCHGRPLFGKLFDTQRMYYGYLTLAETKLLVADLLTLEEYIRDWGDGGTLEFVQDLIAGLNIVVEAQKDLWFHLASHK